MYVFRTQNDKDLTGKAVLRTDKNKLLTAKDENVLILPTEDLATNQAPSRYIQVSVFKYCCLSGNEHLHKVVVNP